MSTPYYSYELYNSNYYKTTTDLTFAMNWLLTNLFNNKLCKIIVKSYIDNQEDSIIEGFIQFDQSLNKLVKISPYDSTHKTIYSPYDTTLFYHTNNSNLYKLLINFDTSSSNQVQQQVQQQPQQPQQLHKKEEKENIHDIFSNIISYSEKLKDASTKLNNVKTENDEKMSCSTDSSDSTESICSEDLNALFENFYTISNEKMTIDNLVKEKEEQLSDLRCEDSFEKRKELKLKEKEEEKWNIFRADLGVHKKICEKYNKYLDNVEKGQTTVNKSLEDFIPPLFEAKFYVIQYLYLNDMINETDYENPEDELYELYNILYNSRYNEDYSVPDDFEEIVSSFISFLPDKNILTEDEIQNGLNNNSNNDILFQQIEQEEKEKNKEE